MHLYVCSNIAAMCASPLEKTVVLGVISRSREAVKGKAQSCTTVAVSSRISSRCRKDGLHLWPPISATQTGDPTPPLLKDSRPASVSGSICAEEGKNGV